VVYYTSWIVVSCRRFGTNYRFHLQGSRSPRRTPGTLRHFPSEHATGNSTTFLSSPLPSLE